jgi:hypothetical protein
MFSIGRRRLLLELIDPVVGLFRKVAVDGNDLVKKLLVRNLLPL